MSLITKMALYNRFCTRCGCRSKTLTSVPSTEKHTTGRMLCPPCMTDVARFPECCAICEDLDGQALIPTMVGTVLMKLCPEHYDSVYIWDYQTLMHSGDDILCDGMQDMETTMASVLSMMDEPDAQRYFPILIRRVNETFGLEEDICIVNRDGTILTA